MKDEQEVVGEEERKINSVTKAVKDYIWKLFLNFSRKWGTPITPTKGNSGKQLLESKSFPFLNISIFEKGIPFFCFVKDSQGVARQLCLKCNHYKTQITRHKLHRSVNWIIHFAYEQSNQICTFWNNSSPCWVTKYLVRDDFLLHLHTQVRLQAEQSAPKWPKTIYISSCPFHWAPAFLVCVILSE